MARTGPVPGAGDVARPARSPPSTRTEVDAPHGPWCRRRAAAAPAPLEPWPRAGPPSPEHKVKEGRHSADVRKSNEHAWSPEEGRRGRALPPPCGRSWRSSPPDRARDHDATCDKQCHTSVQPRASGCRTWPFTRGSRSSTPCLPSAVVQTHREAPGVGGVRSGPGAGRGARRRARGRPGTSSSSGTPRSTLARSADALRSRVARSGPGPGGRGVRGWRRARRASSKGRAEGGAVLLGPVLELQGLLVHRPARGCRGVSVATWKAWVRDTGGISTSSPWRPPVYPTHGSPASVSCLRVQLAPGRPRRVRG